MRCFMLCFFFFQAEDGIRDLTVTGVQTCALPILMAGVAEVFRGLDVGGGCRRLGNRRGGGGRRGLGLGAERSEEHTSELQSQSNLVCRLLLEKKKRIQV